MPSYKAPTDELDFVLFELFDAESLWSSMAPFAGVNRELARAVLEAAAKLAEQEFFPLNQTGDAEGPRWDDGHVHTPPGFRQAYEAFTRGGWLGIAVAGLEYANVFLGGECGGSAVVDLGGNDDFDELTVNDCRCRGCIEWPIEGDDAAER